MFHLGILRLQHYVKDFQDTLAIYKLKRHTRREWTASDVVGYTLWMKTSVEMDGYLGLHVNVDCVQHLMYNVFLSNGETDICLLSCLVFYLFSDFFAGL